MIKKFLIYQGEKTEVTLKCLNDEGHVLISY